MNKNLKYLLLIATGALVLILLYQGSEKFPHLRQPEEKLSFSEFRMMLDPYSDRARGTIYTRETPAGESTATSPISPFESNPFILKISARTIEGRYLKKGVRIEPNDDTKRIEQKTTAFVVESVPGLINDSLIEQLDRARILYRFENPDEGGLLSTIFPMLPLVIVFGLLWMFMLRQIQSTGNKAMAFGKSKARLHPEGKTRVNFQDVAGCDEAKEELVEVVDFLKDPRKFQTIGARIPRGVLLVGPPGTGKTLLARAVAGEAGVPFYSISGSDFVEMFVGVGASRVRDLFEQAKKNSPCIVFIDEIDAVGRLRGAGLGGGHDEREQTLNQLLVEMDGFDENEGVIVVAATNRPDVLDPALLRPGRFDRQVVVDAPDVKGREEILRIHARKVPMTSDVTLSRIARGTPGFTGADLANLINEAALLAARRNKKRVTQEELEEAKDKVSMGPERRSILITDKEKEVIAYHEAGHALLGTLLPYSEPVHKVTIIPRGRALGLTMHLPEDDRHILPKKYWLDRICTYMGGYLAEDLTFNDTATGASNDIQMATNIARRMVCEWGMSEKLGTISYTQENQNVFLARDLHAPRNYSEQTAADIDSEVKRFVHEELERGRKLLTTHRDKLERIAKALLERESINGEELNEIMGGEVSDRQKRAFAGPPTAEPPADMQDTTVQGGPAPAPAT